VSNAGLARLRRRWTNSSHFLDCDSLAGIKSPRVAYDSRDSAAPYGRFSSRFSATPSSTAAVTAFRESSRPSKIDDRAEARASFLGMLRAGPRGGSRGGLGRFWHRIEKRPRRRRNGGFGFRREYTRAWWPRGAKAATSRGSPAETDIPGRFSGRRQAMSEAQRSRRPSPRADTYLLECKRIIAKERRSCQKDARWCRASVTSVFRGNRRRVFRGTMQNPTAPTDKDRNIAHCSKTQ